MNPPIFLWLFKAKCRRVIDGDTLELEIDVGMHGRRIERIRLLGVNTPELRNSDPAGLKAKEFVSSWLPLSPEFPLLIETLKDPDSFGRYLANIWRIEDNAHLNQDLIDSGNAVVFKK